MGTEARNRFPAERLLVRNLQRLEASGLAVWQRSKDWPWIPLLWLLAIPITTLMIFTMLFWAYGVEG